MMLTMKAMNLFRDGWQVLDSSRAASGTSGPRIFMATSKAFSRALASWYFEFCIPSFKEPFDFLKTGSISVLREGGPLPYSQKISHERESQPKKLLFSSPVVWSGESLLEASRNNIDPG